jgi:transposase
MAYRYGDRRQMTLLPPSIEEYLPQDAPARAYDAFVDSLDLADLGLELDPHKVGCPQYDPRAMLKLLLYGYSYGVRSSRKLERETHYNLSFIWMTGGLKPDHKTIAEFRRKNKGPLRKVLKQCARLCLKLNLIEGNTLFVDGTKIRANASIKNAWTEERCRQYLQKIDQRIAEILSECDAADRQEENHPSLVKMNEELQDREALKTRVKSILKDLEAEDMKSTNTTDPDCKPMHSVQGSHASYNMQTVVDEKHGLIVHSDAVSDNNDMNQFADQIDQANATLDQPCQTACADAGYASVDDLEKIDRQGIKVVVPSQRQALKQDNTNPFDKSNFTYDAANDCYMCPAGHRLTYSYTNTAKRTKVYRGGSPCRNCRYFGLCTKQPRGRGISRLLNADLKEKLEAQYDTPESQQTYALRKQKVELPFGHIKRNLKVDSFLLRGAAGVRAEAALFASCFNLSRMISLVGVAGLIAKLAHS